MSSASSDTPSTPCGKLMGEVFGLIDCNNFYVSCERVFRPDLEGKPVIVLSIMTEIRLAARMRQRPSG